MSAAVSASGGSTTGTGEVGNRRLGMIILGIVAVVIAVVVIIGDRTPADDVVLGADNPRPRGALALTILLDELDHEVDVTTTVPGGEADVVVVLQPGLTFEQTSALEDFVDQGGRAVVVGTSPLLAGGRAERIGDTAPAGECDIASLADVERARVVDPEEFREIRLFDVLAGDQACLEQGGAAVVLARPTGDGLVVSVGAGEIFTNRSLDELDNAVLAVGLIAPRVRTNVVVLEPDLDEGGQAGGQLGGGGEGVWDLIPERVWQMFALMSLAALLFIAARGRRMGRVVTETLPANIEGSEFVTALGNLRERSKRPNESADILRNHLRQDLAVSLGLDPNLDAETLAEVASVRTSATREELYRVLEPRPMQTDADLVSFAAEVETVNKAVKGGYGANLVSAGSRGPAATSPEDFAR